MSMQYDIYLKRHIGAVLHNVSWFFQNISPEVMDNIFPNLDPTLVSAMAANHDASKYMEEEYQAYDQYFYQNGKNSAEGKMKFDYAFLHHVRRNPHHWQYWVLIDDDGYDNIDGHQVKALDMPDNDILEMLADWWSFSYNQYLEVLNKEDSSFDEAYDELYNVFDWYKEHENSIIFSTETKNKVERFLDVMRHTLDTNRVLHVV